MSMKKDPKKSVAQSFVERLEQRDDIVAVACIGINELGIPVINMASGSVGEITSGLSIAAVRNMVLTGIVGLNPADFPKP